MLSFKLYTCLTRSCNVNIFRSNLLLEKSKLYITPLRNFRNYKSHGTFSNIRRFAIFGIAGSIGTYVTCAIWEYESYKKNVQRKTPISTKLFINIFRRPPKPQDIYWVIAGINLFIFAMFRVRHNYAHILAGFPLSTQSNPSALFFSMFTHMDLFHIMMNMYALHSFSPLINYFGAPHFMAIYLTGGLISGLGSVIYKQLRHIRIPSVGASGAILTIVGMFASMNPDLMFGIPFISDITHFTFSAQSAVIGLITFDLCGLIFFKFSRFDHMCHLCAVTFGVFYGLVGRGYMWDTRRSWMSWYYYLRS